MRHPNYYQNLSRIYTYFVYALHILLLPHIIAAESTLNCDYFTRSDRPDETNIRFCHNVLHTYICHKTPTVGNTASLIKPTEELGAIAVERGPRADLEAAQLERSDDYRQRSDTDPWQLIGRVADETVLAAMLAVYEDIGDLGEAEMVRQFIRNETTLPPMML